MDLALYHRPGGYYARGPGVGPKGDFFTSPAAHPIFGALVAVQLHSMWDTLGAPERFFVCEMGAGAGLLARDVVDFAATTTPAFARALRYVAMDRHALRGPLSGLRHRAQRVTSSAMELPVRDVVGCILSNELVDSFPVHRFVIADGEPREVYVTLDERAGFVEIVGEPSTPLLTERLNDLVETLPDGFRGEISSRIGKWQAGVSDALAKGFVLTIDYGYEAGQLYGADSSRGTLQTYYRHTDGSSPYERVGRQDITAHVDFSAVAAEGESRGLKRIGLVSQSEFLTGLEFDELLHGLRAMELGQRQRDANVMAARQLVDPAGLGGFKVLVQERGTGITDMAQLAPGRPALDDAEVPLLTDEHVPLLEGRYPHLTSDVEDLWPFRGQAP